MKEIWSKVDCYAEAAICVSYEQCLDKSLRLKNI